MRRMRSGCKRIVSGILWEMSELITQELNNLLSCTQHGFVKGRSTCTNLLDALNDWTYINCTK